MEPTYVQEFDVDPVAGEAHGYVVSGHTVFDTVVSSREDGCMVEARTDEDRTVDRLLELYGDAAAYQAIGFDDETYYAKVENDIRLDDHGIIQSTRDPGLPTTEDDLIAFYRYAEQQQDTDHEYLLA